VVVTMTAGPAARALPDPASEPVPVWPGEQLDLAGWRLFVRRAPAAGGTPAVFVHGLGGASTNWTDLMYLLQGPYDCWAPDLPGFGFSDPPRDGSYRLETHVQAVIALLEHLGTPVHLVGNSLGGASCVRVAARRPDLILTLTLISPALPVLRPRRGTDPRLLPLLVPGIGELVSRRSRLTPAEARVRDILKLAYADPTPIPGRRLDEAIAELERRRGLEWFDTALVASLRGLAGSYLVPPGRSLWADARRISVPTLVIWGRFDKLVSVAIAGRTQQAISGSRLVLLERCGHVAMLEDPVRVAREFLTLVG
jgi:pimeloyl-ACP methyl ester carboxylesterase